VSYSLLILLSSFVIPPARASVQLRRGPDAPAEVRSYFSTLDRLLGQADALALCLARQAPNPTFGTALRASALLDEMAGGYGLLFKDEAGVKAMRGSSARLKAALRGNPSQPLRKEDFQSVFSLEKESVNRWAQLVRQAALDASGPPGSFPANAIVTLENGAELPVLDVSQEPLVKDGRPASPALRALALAASAGRLAGGSFVLGRDRLWMRSGSATFFADLTAASGDAVIRIRCLEPGPTTLDQAEFYFFSKALYDLGFAVSVRNGELVALLSGERASLDPESRVERFSSAWRALEWSRRLRPSLEAYLDGSVSREDNARRLDSLAAVFCAEGGLPFFDETKPESLSSGLAAYLSSGSVREALRARLDATLAGLGLGGMPAWAPLGQRTLTIHYNWPVEAASARGELRETPKGLARAGSYDPLASLAAAVSRKTPLAKELLSRSLEPLVDPSQVIGALGPAGKPPLYLAKRGQWRIGAEDWLLVHLLQEAAGGRVAVFEARRVGGKKTERLDAGRALAVLEEIGVIPKGEGSDPAPPRTGEVFTARVTYDPGKALLGDRVFVTPYVSFGDRDAVLRSRGLITTAGGPQAAMLAALAGIPFVNLPEAVWTESSGLAVEQPVLGPPRGAPGGLQARPVASRRRLVLREGDVIRMDPARGAVELLGAPTSP
jgi:hypothetical protein